MGYPVHVHHIQDYNPEGWISTMSFDEAGRVVTEGAGDILWHHTFDEDDIPLLVEEHHTNDDDSGSSAWDVYGGRETFTFTCF